MGLILALALLSAQDDLIRDLRESNPGVRRNACSSLGLKGVRESVPHIIELLRDEQVEYVRTDAVGALEILTGQRAIGPDHAKWSAWWDTEGRKSFPVTGASPEEVRRIIQPLIEDVKRDADKAKTEIRVLLFVVAAIVLIFVMVMTYFVGHVSAKLKEWKELVRQAGAYIDQSQQITKRTDRVIDELEAKKSEILEFTKRLKEEKESEIERYNDLLQQNTAHQMREEVMGLRQKAEKELEETLSQLRQQIELDLRRLGGDQKEKVEKDFKAQHERFMNEVEAHTLFLQANFTHTHGKPEEALRLYKKLVLLKPDHQVAWERMGTAYRELSRYDEALEAYQKAVELDPADPASYYNMAATFARQRKREKMLETLALAVKNDGEFKDEALNDPAFRDYWNDPAFKDLAEA